MSARVLADPFADVRVQPQIWDRTDCLIESMRLRTLFHMCEKSDIFTCFSEEKTYYWQYFKLRYFAFRFTTTTKEYNASHSGKNVLYFMSAGPFFSPVVSA